MMGGGMAGDAMTGSSGSGMAGSTASGDNITGDNTQTDFATKVHPIFLSKCLPCHSFEHGNADLDAAYAFTQMRLGGADSLAVYDDILLRTMATDGSIMPPSDACVTFNEGGCLTQTEWDTINDWVEAGAQR